MGLKLEETYRERIARLLKEAGRPLTAEEIAVELGLTPREVYEHLKHVAKSVYSRSGGTEALLMEPPRCRKCGYVFKDLDSPRKPSRCPKCRSEWISSPRFLVARVD